MPYTFKSLVHQFARPFRSAGYLVGQFMLCSPPIVLIALLGTGTFLIILSYLIGIGDIMLGYPTLADPPRQVGYLYAPNWAVTYTIILPFMAAFILNNIQNIVPLLDQLSQKRMVAHRNLSALPSRELLVHHWERTRRRTSLFLVFILIPIAGLISYSEFYYTNVIPLALDPRMIDVSAIDWGIGALANPNSSELHRYLNLIFDFIAFTLQTVFIFFLVSYLIIMTIFFWWLFSTLYFQEGLVVVPDLLSEDSRQGFEIFEPHIFGMIYVGAFAFVAGYFTRIQNLYLHCIGHKSIFDLIESEVSIVWASWASLTPARIFETVTSTTPSCDNALSVDLGEILVILFTSVSVLAIVCIIWYSLGKNARYARQKVIDSLSDSNMPNIWRRGNRELLVERARRMDCWPLKYPSLNVFVAVCLFMCASIVMYRVGVVAVLVAFPIMIRKIIDEIRLSGVD